MCIMQASKAGGDFENLRDAEKSDIHFSGVAEIVEGNFQPEALSVAPSTLVLFRGHNLINRVTPT